MENEFEQLNKLGVKTIVCLRWSKKAIEEELRICKALNLEVVSIPLNYWRLPNREEIARFFEIVDEQSKHPIFLHCKHGSDRTGMFSAFYRMKYDGWSADRAYEEMKNSGFHKIRMHHFKFAVFGFENRIQEES